MRAWIEVDLGALARNARTVAARARVPLLPMVKADAYGLGLVPVTRALEALDPWGFGVATVAEGSALRAAGIRRPVVVFTPPLLSELYATAQADLRPALGDPAVIAAWAATGRPWHLAIDTGMHRAGVPWEAVGALRDALLASPPEGAFTHFHSADLDDGSRETQLARFTAALGALPARPPLVHTENSAAIERLAGPSAWDLVRPGVFLYGVGTTPARPEPVASVRAAVVEVRDVAAGESVGYGATWRAPDRRHIATLAIGYGDGYCRSFGNRGHVILNGHLAPVVGTVTMDMTMIDVTGRPCRVGDTATLLGRADDRALDAVTVAAAGGISPYELLVGLQLRAPRVYVGTSGSGWGSGDA